MNQSCLRKMEKPLEDDRRTISKKAELKALWRINLDQPLHIAVIEGHQAELQSLHKQAWDKYGVKLSKYKHL